MALIVTSLCCGDGAVCSTSAARTRTGQLRGDITAESFELGRLRTNYQCEVVVSLRLRRGSICGIFRRVISGITSGFELKMTWNRKLFGFPFASRSLNLHRGSVDGWAKSTFVFFNWPAS